MLSASGGLCPPDPLTRGSAPGPRWRLCPQTPVIGSCSAISFAMVPPQPLTPSAAYGQVECETFIMGIIIMAVLTDLHFVVLGPTKSCPMRGITFLYSGHF